MKGRLDAAFWSGVERNCVLEGAGTHFVKDGLSIENEQSGKAEPEMPKVGHDPREKHAPKTLADILESLVEEEFARNRVPIVHQIAADAASRLLEQKSH